VYIQPEKMLVPEAQCTHEIRFDEAHRRIVPAVKGRPGMLRTAGAVASAPSGVTLATSSKNLSYIKRTPNVVRLRCHGGNNSLPQAAQPWRRSLANRSARRTGPKRRSKASYALSGLRLCSRREAEKP
jgi:hypothetical protein